ncbi:MAG: hypothetical protein HYR67_11840 [Bacteroidetes bacterium]|nr:hypothetical protein [Bacteroidota bacterium]
MRDSFHLMKSIGIICTLLIFLMGCASYQQTGIEVASKGAYCDPRNEPVYDSTFVPKKNIDSILHSPLSSKYPQHLLLIANASGVLHLLQEMYEIEKQMRLNTGLTNLYLQKKLQVSARLSLVATEVASMESEFSCERDRCQQVINYLSEKENLKIRSSTAASIVMGALTTIGTGATSDEQRIKNIAIVGGTITAVLGLRTLFIKNRIEFSHARNVLADIWFKRMASTTYPASIWYVLTEKSFTDEQKYPINYYIRQRWQSQLESYSSSKELKLEKLFFGEGGRYGIQELRIRENMLSLIQVGVSLTNHDLKLLMVEMAK